MRNEKKKKRNTEDDGVREGEAVAGEVREVDERVARAAQHHFEGVGSGPRGDGLHHAGEGENGDRLVQRQHDLLGLQVLDEAVRVLRGQQIGSFVVEENRLQRAALHEEAVQRHQRGREDHGERGARRGRHLEVELARVRLGDLAGKHAVRDGQIRRGQRELHRQRRTGESERQNDLHRAFLVVVLWSHRGFQEGSGIRGGEGGRLLRSDRNRAVPAGSGVGHVAIVLRAETLNKQSVGWLFFQVNGHGCSALHVHVLCGIKLRATQLGKCARRPTKLYLNNLRTRN